MISALTVKILLIPLGMLLLYKLYYYLRMGYYVNKLGGPKCTIMGNMYDISVPSDQLFTSLRYWATKWQIYKLWAGYIPTVNVFTPDDVEIFLSSMKHTEKTRIYELLMEWLGTGLLTSAGEKWHTRRKLLTPTFHFTILQQFVPIFYENGESITQEFEKTSGEVLNIIPSVTDITLRTICETSLGTKLSEKDEIYRKNVEDFGLNLLYRIKRPWFYTNIPWLLFPIAHRNMRIIKDLHTFSNNVINKRRESYKANNKKDIKMDGYVYKKRMAMLDLLLENEENGEIDHNGIREEVDTFVFEGHDTTSMSIAFTLLLLANHKNIQDKVVEELNDVLENSNQPITYKDLQKMNYLERVIKESLRLFPSVPFIARNTTTDVVTSTGYFIPSGTMINIHIYDLHHMPEYWPDPEKFDPDRFLPENSQGRHPYSYVPFSAGPRNCIGQKFAMLELKTVIACIVRKLIIEPVDTQNVAIMTDIIIRPRDGIKLKFKQRA